MRTTGIIGLIVVLGLFAGVAAHAQGVPGAEPPDDAIGRTPPRLSYIHGQVSFWRPGAQDWVQAQVNTPLAPEDMLFTGSPGASEVQIGPRAFVRASVNTQFGLENQEPDFLQFKVTAGRVSFDVRSIEPGHAVEVNTPNAAITIEHPGHYRVDVTGERTAFITRRSGRATITPPNGQAVAVAASEEVVIDGVADPRISGFAAPPLDEWDRWNYARTDGLLDAVSARYVTPGTYGVGDLDRYGRWRVVDQYGPVWIPTGVPAGWAPYTTGSWVLDPFYGWTWVDTAPWGWAPYHHGRWVHVGGFWGWAPGPVLVRPVYAPALVAFFGGGVGVGVGVGGPLVGWVALGWGEPCVPWWGRPHFVRRPWWGGWGGPRYVNNVIVHQTTVVHVEQITVYQNVHVHNAVVVVNEDRFGRGRIPHGARVAQTDVQSLRPTHAAPGVSKTPDHFVPVTTRGVKPPDDYLRRPVVATRPPHRGGVEVGGAEPRGGPAPMPTPAPRLVPTPQRPEPASVVSRPPFGKGTIERPVPDRSPAPPRQRGEEARRTEPTPETRPGIQPPSKPALEPKVPSPPVAAPPLQPGGEPRVGGPTPAAPQAPAGRERPGGREQGPGVPPAAPRQAPPQPGGEPRVGGPTPAPPHVPAPRTVTPPSPAPSKPAAGAVAQPAPPGRREVTRQPDRPLPGEPANRLAPDRGEVRPRQQDKGQEVRPPQGRPQGRPEAQPHERKGG
jgi:hypothetical protein